MKYKCFIPRYLSCKKDSIIWQITNTEKVELLVFYFYKKRLYFQEIYFKCSTVLTYTYVNAIYFLERFIVLDLIVYF